LRNVSLSFLEHDERVPIVLQDVEDVCLERVDAQRAEGVPTIVLRDVRGVEVTRCRGIADTRIDAVDRATL
jgi:hypothetical protein